MVWKMMYEIENIRKKQDKLIEEIKEENNNFEIIEKCTEIAKLEKRIEKVAKENRNESKRIDRKLK